MHPHILLYTDDADAGGVARYNHAILGHLAEHGLRVNCVQRHSRSPLLRLAVRRAIRHHWLPYDPVRDFARSLTDIGCASDLFAELNPHLILFSNGCPLSSFAAKEAVVRLGVPFVIIEGFAAEYLAERFAEYVPRLQDHYAHARAVIAVSNATLHLLRERFGLPPSIGEVIYYGRPDQYFQPQRPAVRPRLRAKLKIADDEVVCLTTARLEEVKGHQFLIAALARLRQLPQWQRLRFVWIGAGSLHDRLKAELERDRLTDRVHLMGQRWDAADWLDAADLFVLPSLAEGMPLAVMEAMAKGLPVMATGVSGIPEELGDLRFEIADFRFTEEGRVTGRLMPDPWRGTERLVEELVATIIEWAGDAELRRRIGAGCRERALVMFREERMLRQTRWMGIRKHAIKVSRQFSEEGGCNPLMA